MSVRARLTALLATLVTAAVLAGTLVLGWAAAPAQASLSTADQPIGGPQLAARSETWQLPAGVPRPPALPAKGYLLADLTTGQILVARDVHLELRTASTMKVLTALTLLPRLAPGQVYRASRADANIDGSKVGIVAGSTYTAHQLFLGMMLPSGNDAANALANAAGGVPATVAAMEQEATTLGALDTAVRDPSGLDAPGQHSSAYDLALIARAAMARADFRQLVATKSAKFPGASVKGKPRKAFAIQNHNELLAKYPGAIGVKTGYTVAAKWTYIGAARRGGHTYLVTEMGLTQMGWKPATKLLDWAFAHGTAATPVGRLVEPGELAAAAPTPASAANAPVADALTTRHGSSQVGAGARVMGVAGLGCAALIVAGLGLGAARRRRLR